MQTSKDLVQKSNQKKSSGYFMPRTRLTSVGEPEDW